MRTLLPLAHHKMDQKERTQRVIQKVSDLLNGWQALQLAVEHTLGAGALSAKATELAEDLEFNHADRINERRPCLTCDEIEEYLRLVLEEDFNTVVEDGSTSKIAVLAEKIFRKDRETRASLGPQHLNVTSNQPARASTRSNSEPMKESTVKEGVSFAAAAGAKSQSQNETAQDTKQPDKLLKKVEAILETWQALKLAIEHQLGLKKWPDKVTELAEDLEYNHSERIKDSKPNLSSYEIEDFLSVVLVEDYNTVVEDGSTEKIATILEKIFRADRDNQASAEPGRFKPTAKPTSSPVATTSSADVKEGVSFAAALRSSSADAANQASTSEAGADGVDAAVRNLEHKMKDHAAALEFEAAAAIRDQLAQVKALQEAGNVEEIHRVLGISEAVAHTSDIDSEGDDESEDESLEIGDRVAVFATIDAEESDSTGTVVRVLDETSEVEVELDASKSAASAPAVPELLVVHTDLTQRLLPEEDPLQAEADQAVNLHDKLNNKSDESTLDADEMYFADLHSEGETMATAQATSKGRSSALGTRSKQGKAKHRSSAGSNIRDNSRGDSMGGVSRVSQNVAGGLKRANAQHEKNRIRHTGRDDRATNEQVMDPRTKMMIFRLVSNHTLDSFHGCISTGKEANVYHAFSSRDWSEGSSKHPHENRNNATSPPRTEVAVKVFKTAILVFKDRDKYVTGEHRYRNGYCKKNPRKMVKVGPLFCVQVTIFISSSTAETALWL